MFRIVQGTTAGPNVYSNWMNPRNVIAYDGSSYEAATHCEAQLTITSAAALLSGGAVSNMILELKFALNNGVVEEFWKLDVLIAAGAATVSQDAVKVAYNAAVKPDWLMATCSVDNAVATAATGANTITTPGTDDVVFTGNVPGSTLTSSGDAYEAEDAAQISVMVTATNDIDTQTYVTSVELGGDQGVGSYYKTKAYEDKTKGIMYGYYNRRNLPNTPDNGAVLGSTYDFISIVATKDGSSASGQIHGIDNLDEVFIAGKEAVATISGGVSTSFVSKLNAIISLNNISI